MTVRTWETAEEIGAAAAEVGASAVAEALTARGEPTIILATGSSQFTMLEHLVRSDID